MRRDIEFKTEDGVTLRGWHYAAKGVTGPAPTVIMAHGFSATREIFLDSFARSFRTPGSASSSTTTAISASATARRAATPIRGRRSTAIATRSPGRRPKAMSTRTRIGVWGSSYSGGHVLVVAALDRRVKCVVSQVPLTWGFESARRLIRGDHWAGLRAAFEGDRAARAAASRAR